jgi:two-component system, chemotaxis family, sensor kinase CheA
VSLPPDDRGSELRELFFESARELLQALNDEALKLEKSPGDAEVIRSLRRIVHTLKGDAAACGFHELSELAHELEDALALENPAVAAQVAEVVFPAADLFAAMLDAYHANRRKLPSAEAVRARIQSLAAAPAPKVKKSRARKAGTASAASSYSEYEQLAIASALEQGKSVYQVHLRLDPHCGMPIAGRQLIQVSLAGLGEVLASAADESQLGKLQRLSYVLASDKAIDQIQSKCKIPTVVLDVTVELMKARGAKARPAAKASKAGAGAAPVASPVEATPAPEPAVVEPAPVASPVPVPETVSAPANGAPVQAETLLRVDASKIDNVLNLVGELILAKSMLQQTLNEFTLRFPKEALRGKFSDAMNFQARVLNDLQRSVMKIRMVPVEQLYRRFPRIVRDVSRQCGKEVELVLVGENTDLDKGILDAISEPLTHLVRNAIGHGLETPEERARLGKRSQGTLRLSAYHQGHQLVIEVADDGLGIDAAKVRERALSQGLLSAEEASRLTESEVLELILRPGFSTAEEITELSGRGVGLDVVQSVVHRLKGTVQIQTEAGRGTTFRLRLPLTLSIIQALMFRVEERIYAIPLSAVAEIARTFESDIHEVEHYEVLQLRNEVLPLLRLGSAALGDVPSAQRKVFVLVIQVGDRKFGLAVDSLVGEEELVIKALDDQSVATDLVSGASILGDGHVVLILNLTALVDRFVRARSDRTNGPRTGLLSSRATLAAAARFAAGGQA